MITHTIDASALLGYYLESSPGAVQQIPLLLNQLKTKNLHLISTAFLDLEFANGLRFSLKNQKVAELIFSKYLKLPIQKIPLTSKLSQESLRLSYQNQTTVYNSAYHILALSRDATFLTCDQDYYRKTSHLGSIKLLT
ncbi:MAG: type II toxin-antitoxin system VapC family toxin [Candidatus Chisholmbacteria bacterium]|nr:type II toxin-antitoxin system VapC family toxin [Candidatus Chisholmbacteria bacterium]